MPWGLNLGGPWKEAPFDLLIPRSHTIPNLLSGAAGAHIWSQYNYFSLKKKKLMVCVKLLKLASPQIQLPIVRLLRLKADLIE